jgi:Enhancer of rudimentary
MPHVLLLCQTDENKSSREYREFDRETSALEGVCQLFEERLKILHPTQSEITYDIKDLFQFIDDLPDLSCLV